MTLDSVDNPVLPKILCFLGFCGTTISGSLHSFLTTPLHLAHGVFVLCVSHM